MRKIILFFLLPFMLNAQWIKQESGTEENLTDVVMLDSVTAIAVGQGRSILRTSDAGKTWKNLTIMLSSVVPWNGVAFADSLNGVVVGDNQIRFSSDGGKIWRVNTPPYRRKFLSALYPFPGVIYVGADSGWIFHSTDTGKTWSAQQIDSTSIRSIFAWFNGPTEWIQMFALTPMSLYSSWMVTSKPWEKTNLQVQGLGSEIFDGEFSRDGKVGYVVGVQGDKLLGPRISRIKLFDTSWTYLTIGITVSGILYGVSAPSEKIVYTCGTNGLIFNSIDGGENWQKHETPTSQNLNSISFFNNSVGMAVGDSGVILYTSNGGVIPEINGTLAPYGLQDKVITSLAAEELDYGDNFYIGTNCLFAGTDKDGIFKTDPLSKLTEWAPLGLTGKYINALGVQRWGRGPAEGLKLFAAVIPKFEDSNSTLVYQREAYFTTDTIWAALDSGIVKTNTLVNAINAFYYSGHTPPGNILAGTNSGIYNYKVDFWEQVNNDASIPDIDVYPHWFGNLVWATGNYGRGPSAFKSTNSGVTWSQIFIPHPLDGSSSSVCINKRYPDSVYFAVNGSIYLSPDSGTTINEIFTSAQGSIKVVELDPLKPENIYAGGSSAQGDYYFCISTDGGKTWNRIESLFSKPIRNITSISVVNNPSGNTLVFLGTEGTGVWCYTSPVTTNIKPIKNLPEEFRLYQNYPNPFNPMTKIKYSIPVETLRATSLQNVTLKIYDILGNEVVTLVNEDQPAGEYEVALDGSKLSSGIYFYQLKVGNFINTRKMILMK